MAGHIYPRDVAERRTVAGLFPDRDRAGQAIDALKAAGFTGGQIGVALRDRTAQGVLLEEARRAPPRGRSGADSWGASRAC